MTRDEQLIDLLWDYMRKDSEHRDRVQTAWGTKTKQGLVASIERIFIEHNADNHGQHPEIVSVVNQKNL